MLQPHPRRQARPGFTLVEMLMVLSIILVLAALTTSAVFKFRRTGPVVATKSNLQNLKAKLDLQWKEVSDRANKEAMSPAAQANIIAWYAAQTPSVTVTPSDPRLRAKYVEARLAQVFPQNFSEAMGPAFVPPVPAYTAYLGGLGVTAGNASTFAAPEVQAAVCLLMALQFGEKNQGLTPELLGSTAALQLPLGNSGQKAYACVDAFEKPLLFTRTFGGAALTPAILSGGPDLQYGVDFTTFAVTSPAQALDNLSTTTP